MSAIRSATHAIAGYHYQFDKSIIEILRSKNQAPITLEGIEDIDHQEEFIQCKYHSSQRYTPSKIKVPLAAFLNHFSVKRGGAVYTLYAHFKEGTLPASIQTSELKSILGATLDEIDIDDNGLHEFSCNYLRLIPALDFDSQRQEAINVICDALSCTKEEAIEYYYGNALHEVMRLSCQQDPLLRITTRVAFVESINRKSRLYSIWTQQMAGEREYHIFVRKQLQSHDALAAAKKKLFYLNNAVVQNSGITGLVTLCKFLVDRFFKIGESLISAYPPTVVVDASNETLLSLKRNLLEKKILYNDGFEHIDFQPWVFDLDPIMNRVATRNNRPTDKIAKSSYHLRILSRDCYQRVSSQLTSLDVVFALGSDSEAFLISEKHDLIHLHAANSYQMLISVLNK